MVEIGRCCHDGQIKMVSRPLFGLAVCLAMTGKLVVHRYRHRLCAGHACFGHCSLFSNLGDYRGGTRTGITRHGQLHKEQTEQCEVHCQKAVTTGSRHSVMSKQMIVSMNTSPLVAARPIKFSRKSRILCTYQFSPQKYFQTSILSLFILGGFNRSSQHWVVDWILSIHLMLRLVSSSRVFFGASHSAHGRRRGSHVRSIGTGRSPWGSTAVEGHSCFRSYRAAMDCVGRRRILSPRTQS